MTKKTNKKQVKFASDWDTFKANIAEFQPKYIFKFK